MGSKIEHCEDVSGKLKRMFFPYVSTRYNIHNLFVDLSGHLCRRRFCCTKDLDPNLPISLAVQ